MARDNMRIWDAVSKTDPKHTKNFKRAGGFQGTAIKPIWLIKRLTEQFGPAGTGWGMDEPKFQTVAAGDEILVFCTVALWYSADAQHPSIRGIVYGVGGDKVLGKNKYGPFTNDEAFKASYTDALSNAMKQIGMGADIHMGLFEDEKYVRETAREFVDGAAASESAGGGTDFRPPGPRQSSANGRQLAAADPHLVDQDRAKGTVATKPAIGKKTAVEKAADWTDKAIETLNLSAHTVDSLSRFWSDNTDKISWLEDNAADQHERFVTAYDNAATTARAKVQA